MGLFGDLFKEKIDWSEDELKALWIALSAMAQADGNIDENEEQMITNAMSILPGYKITNFDDFINSTNTYKPNRVNTILRNMHKDKRKMVVGLLYTLADSDGDFHENEQKFFNVLTMRLGIKKKDF